MTLLARFDSLPPIRRNFLAAALLFVAVFAIYTPTFGGDFVFDDHDLVVENPAVSNADVRDIFTSDLYRHAPEGRSGYYRPLQALAYAAERRVFGIDPFGYRLKSAAIHAANAFLVFLLLSALFGRPLPALAAALAFAASPLHAAAVAYVSGRADLDALFFMLASLVCLERFHRGKGGRFYAAALLAALPAAFCRESALLLPLFAAAVSFASAAPPRRAILASAGYLLPAGVFLAARAAVVGSGPVSAPAVVEGLAAAARLTVLAAAPLDAHPMRTFAPGGALGFWAAGFAVSAVLLAWSGAARKDRALLFSLAWLLTAFLPLPWLAGFFGGGRITAAEHWFYAAAPGFAAFAALAFGGGARRAAALAVLSLAVYAPLAVPAAFVWTSEERLYRATLEREPSNAKARFNLAWRLRREGRLDEAEKLLESVRRQEPASWDVEIESGELAAARGNAAEARRRFERALALRPESPQALTALGGLAARHGETAEARRLYAAALAAKPGYGTAEAALGDLEFAAGNFEEAARRYARAEEAGYGNFSLRLKRGTALGKSGRFEESVVPLEAALRERPDDAEALKNLGASYANMGRTKDAAVAWRKALEKEPDPRLEKYLEEVERSIRA